MNIKTSFHFYQLITLLEAVLISQAGETTHANEVVALSAGLRTASNRRHRNNVNTSLLSPFLMNNDLLNSVVIETTIESSIQDEQGLWNQENMDKCGQIWGLTTQEQDKLNELRVRLSDIDHWKNNPYEVIHYLKEYDGNVKESEKMFRKMIEWRLRNNVDRLLEEYKPPSKYKYFPVGILRGVDIDGDPIHVERPGSADSIGLLDLYGEEEMSKYGTWVREIQSRGKWQHKYEETYGHPVKHFTVILDMEGIDRNRLLNSKLLAIGAEVSRISQEYYSGYTKRVIILRAPTIFRMTWSMFKPFISQKIQDSMVLTSPKDYRQVLEKYVDLAVMPSVIFPDVGHGEAIDEFNPVWEGGPIPPSDEPNEHTLVIETTHIDNTNVFEESTSSKPDDLNNETSENVENIRVCSNEKNETASGTGRRFHVYSKRMTSEADALETAAPSVMILSSHSMLRFL